MAIESIAKTLGAGSGIDIPALVSGLVDAQFAGKKNALTKRDEALTAQISGLATLRSAMTGFDAALKSLVRGGDLTSRYTSSNEAAIKISPLEGSAPGDLSARVGVTQLTSAQVSTTNTPVAAGTAFRAGSLSLRFGTDIVGQTGTVDGFAASGDAIDILIEEGDTTLAGIAAKINAAGAGVTAKVIVDGAGERLSIAGKDGADQAFEITATDAGDTEDTRASLSAFAVGRTATETSSGTRARDAIVTVDGVQYRRQTNSITDLVPGAKLDLVGISAAPVQLGAAKPTAALTGALNNFVEAYNEMLALVKEQNDPVAGALRADNAVETLARGLKRITTMTLAPAGAAGAPRTLAELGVATARDGTLSVNGPTLARAMALYPGQVEKIFALGTGTTESGLSAALGTITKQVTDKAIGLDASTAIYQRGKTTVANATLKATDAAETLRVRLTKQFAAMDARTAAYKSTQTFLENQIKAWNRSDA
jgi:flagellar hook-associated protein 2